MAEMKVSTELRALHQELKGLDKHLATRGADPAYQEQAGAWRARFEAAESEMDEALDAHTALIGAFEVLGLPMPEGLWVWAPGDED